MEIEYSINYKYQQKSFTRVGVFGLCLSVWIYIFMRPTIMYKSPYTHTRTTRANHSDKANIISLGTQLTNYLLLGDERLLPFPFFFL